MKPYEKKPLNRMKIEPYDMSPNFQSYSLVL